MTKYIDQSDGQVVTIEKEVTLIDDNGQRKKAIVYFCHKRNVDFCESKRRFDVRYRTIVNMPDTGE